MVKIIFYSAQAINILFVIFVLFFERKESTRRFVWILILLFFPVGGMIFYALFSGNFFTGTKRMHEAKQAAQQFTKDVRREQKITLTESKRIPNPVIKEFLPLITMNLMEGKSLLVSTDTAILYTRGEDFFEDLCKELESAKVSIFMEYFIFHKDNIGKRIMEILCRKAREGVDVKLIYDDLGSITTPTRFFRQLNKAGGESRPFFQIRIGLPLTLNYRNHRKLTVIDSDRAFIGGINIGDEYENKNKRFKPLWRDTVVRLTGSSVLTLQINFLSDWYSIDAWNSRTKGMEDAKKYFPKTFTDFFTKTDGKEAEKARTLEFRKSFLDSLSGGNKIPTQIVTAGPNEKHKANIEDTFIRMIMSARKNIFIQTPYFTPDEGFYTVLKLAAYTGIKVQIMIPSQWDKFFMKAASYEFARELCAEGAEFYLYPGFIHSKMMTIDGKVSSIGTTNIDVRSFRLLFEENAIFYDTNFTAECERIFEEDREVCRLVKKEDFDKRFIIQRAWGSFCKLFSPLL